MLDNQASTKTADIKVQVEGCLTGATTDVTPGGGAKQSVPVLGKCPADATTTAAPGATTTAATDMSSDRLYSEKCKNAGGNQVKCMRTAGCVKTGGPPEYSPTQYTYCHLIDCAAQKSCEDCAYKGCGWQQGKCQDVPGGSKQGQKKSGSICRVGIFLDCVRLTTRPPPWGTRAESQTKSS